MTRKELASKMYAIMKKDLNIKSEKLWQAIAETDDGSLLDEYIKHTDGNKYERINVD